MKELKKFNKINYPALNQMFVAILVYFIAFVFTIISSVITFRLFAERLTSLNKYVVLPLIIIGICLLFLTVCLITLSLSIKSLVKKSEEILTPVLDNKEDKLSKYSKEENAELISNARMLAKNGQPYINTSYLICFIILVTTFILIALMFACVQQYIISISLIVLTMPMFITFPILISKQNKKLIPLYDFIGLEEEYKGNLKVNFTINELDIVNLTTKNTSGLNLNLHDYQTVFIVNENDKEKETLADTLSFFVKPIGGQIYVNGKNSIQIIKEDLLNKTCVLDSKEFPMLFSAIEGEQSEELKAKVEYAKFKVDNGFDKIKEAKTRIELINAVFKDADIYIVNSIFDNLKEEEYLSAVRALEEMLPDKLFIFLTSKFYNYFSSNRVVVFENGKVKLNDSFDNVSKLDSRFSTAKKTIERKVDDKASVKKSTTRKKSKATN